MKDENSLSQSEYDLGYREGYHAALNEMNEKSEFLPKELELPSLQDDIQKWIEEEAEVFTNSLWNHTPEINGATQKEWDLVFNDFKYGANLLLPEIQKLKEEIKKLQFDLVFAEGEFKRFLKIINTRDATIEQLKEEIERLKLCLEKGNDWPLIQVLNERDATIEQQKKEIERATSLLKKYELWEADLIMDNGCWEPSGMATYPTMTNNIYEAMLKLQKERNEILYPQQLKSTNQ